MSAAQGTTNPYTANANARALVLAQALEMKQSIFNATFAPVAGTPLVTNIAPRNVGLVKRFILEVTATVQNTGGTTATLTPFGPGNLLSSIVLTDLQNINRVQTTGWHLAFLATIRKQNINGAAYVTDSPIAYGSNFAVIKAPTTIATGTSGTVKMIYEIPCAYSDDNLQGAIYANVINATFNLQCTLNPVAVGGVGADPTFAVYTGSAGAITSVTYNCYQVYLDQLPQGQQGVILPQLDLSTIYDLKNTALTGMTVGQDFPIPYSNYRNFLSTISIYDNNGVLNPGTDVNYWALQSANLTNIWKVDPFLASYDARNRIGDDMPVGTYYFDHRRKPLNTVQYGNLQLLLNASAVTAGAQVLCGFEAFSQQQIVTGAGSLAAG